MRQASVCSICLASSLEADLLNVLAVTSLGSVDWKCGCLRKLLWRWAQPLQGVRLFGRLLESMAFQQSGGAYRQIEIQGHIVIHCLKKKKKKN